MREKPNMEDTRQTALDSLMPIIQSCGLHVDAREVVNDILTCTLSYGCVLRISFGGVPGGGSIHARV